MAFDMEKALKIAAECAGDAPVIITKEAEEIIDSWKSTPRVFSANDLVGLDEDNEDHMIYERRCYESERRMR